jgi:PAS domain S-box-containing protein
MSRPLRVLLIEDSEDDATLLLRELRRGDYEVLLERVDTPSAMRAALERQPWEVVLSDYSLPRFSAPAALALLHECELDLPFIIISGTIGEESAVAALKAGAHDFIVKGQLARLIPAIERELREAEVRRARHLAEAQLRLAEAKYRTLVEQMPAVTYVAQLGAAGRWQYISPQIEPLLGFSPHEWLADAERWLQQLHADDRERVLAEAARSRASGAPFRSEYRLLARDGRVVWFRDEAVVARDASGQSLVLQGVLFDITERKQAEAALAAERSSLARRVEERTADLRLANVELARGARLKDEFLASMSHELRTPLNAILGLSEALQERVYGSVTAQQLKTLQSIEESGQHLLALINDILDLSKAEAGKLELDIAAVVVEQLCQASLRLIKQAAHQKQLSVTTTIDPAVTAIRGDARRLKQILVNLLSNAVKFTPQAGSVGLEVAGDAAQQLVRITVWDTGIGIAPDDLPRLFQPFVQLDRRLAREYAGTGLGLSLVYHMVELHGGSVTVESQVDQGSCFTVALPWSAQAAAERLGEASVASGAGRPALDQGLNSQGSPAAADQSSRSLSESGVEVMAPTILLAEDNQANIDLLSDYLLVKGYQVVVARNGVEAITLAQDNPPAVILMDIQMPGVDGLEATRRIRADADLAAIPIVALTALAMPGDRERCLNAGANDYLSKPVNLKRLVEVIETYLRREKQV